MMAHLLDHFIDTQLRRVDENGISRGFQRSDGSVLVALVPVSYTHLTLPTILRV